MVTSVAWAADTPRDKSDAPTVALSMILDIALDKSSVFMFAISLKNFGYQV